MHFNSIDNRHVQLLVVHVLLCFHDAHNGGLNNVLSVAFDVTSGFLGLFLLQ